MKLVLGRTVTFLRPLVAVGILAAAGLFMGEQGLMDKRKLQDKHESLEKENRMLSQDIRSLERRVTLLRSDARTIEKAAKCKLGMARQGETVYIFRSRNRTAAPVISNDSLIKRVKSP